MSSSGRVFYSASLFHIVIIVPVASYSSNCGMLYPNYSADADKQAVRFHHLYYGCLCNQYAYEAYPNECTMICDQMLNVDTCKCRNPLFAGPGCKQKVCKFGSYRYCLKDGWLPTLCDGFLNFEGKGRWETCPCVQGTVVNGTCQCKENYVGQFCERYSPSITTTMAPKITPSSGSDRYCTFCNVGD